MSIDQELLQVILEDPENDTPRLIYADWLDDQGDPRGEFYPLPVRINLSINIKQKNPNWITNG